MPLRDRLQLCNDLESVSVLTLCAYESHKSHPVSKYYVQHLGPESSEH